MSIAVTEGNPAPGPSSAVRLVHLVMPLVGVAVVVALWWAATIVFDVQSFILPTPGEVVAALVDRASYLLDHARVTLWTTVQGFLLAILVAVPLALIITASQMLERTVYPLLLMLNAVPKVAIAPLLVVWMGFGQLPKVVLVFLVCFFPIVISTAAGLASTPADLVELGRSVKASWWQTLRKIRVPAAVPQFFVGLKVAITLAVIGAVIAEFVGATSGLGYVIVISGASADTALAFASMVLLGVMSIVLFYGLVAIERRLLPWVEHQ